MMKAKEEAQKPLFRRSRRRRRWLAEQQHFHCTAFLLHPQCVCSAVQCRADHRRLAVFGE